MGGYGIWDFIAQYPDKFAAAVPVAGGGDPGSAEIIKDVPIWNFHSRADEVVPVSESQMMIDALRAAGGHPRYTEYPLERTAAASTIPTANRSYIEWMYAQARPAAIPEPSTLATLLVAVVLMGSLRRVTVL